MTDRSELEPGRNLPLPFQPGADLPAQQQQAGPAYYPEEEEALSLEHYLQALMRRKWMLAAITITFVVLAALQVFTATPMYTARARMQIDPESSRIVPFQEVAGSEMAGGWFMENYLWTQTENLKSQTMALRVVRKLDLVESEVFNQPIKPGFLTRAKSAVLKLASAPVRWSRDRDAGPQESIPGDIEGKLARKLQHGVSAQPVKNTRLIEVSYTGPESELAATIVNTLNEEFIEQHLEGKYNATTRASDFLRTQLEDLQIEVERSEKKLLEYAQRSNIVNLSERETIARKRLADLSDELTVVEGELITSQARHEAARSVAQGELPEALKTDAVRRLEARLSDARSELAGYSSRYGPEWPTVKETRLEIEDLEDQLTQEKSRSLMGAQQEYELARDRHARLAVAVADQRTLVDDLNRRSIQYNILKREVDSNKELYEGLLQRLKEAGVAAGLRSSNIRIADLAKPPRGTSSPRRTRSLTLALILGLVVGTGMVLLVEALDNTLKTSDDVTQNLGLPALGVVPGLGPKEKLHRRVRWPFGEPPAKSRPHLVENTESLQEARALEAYRSLRTALLLSHSGNPPQVILVTSALPGEGKSTTVANTAVALAQTGARTVIVDLDMRQPRLADSFGLSAEQGMSTFLSGNSDISSQIHETGVPNLFLVPAGPRAPNPAELISSERMLTGMQLLREYFTYVVIDTPPVLELSDALAASPHADGVILVARGGKTRRKSVQRAADGVVQVGAKLLGVLVNDVDIDKSGYGYYHGYTRGYFDRYHRDNDSNQRSA